MDYSTNLIQMYLFQKKISEMLNDNDISFEEFEVSSMSDNDGFLLSLEVSIQDVSYNENNASPAELGCFDYLYLEVREDGIYSKYSHKSQLEKRNLSLSAYLRLLTEQVQEFIDNAQEFKDEVYYETTSLAQRKIDHLEAIC